MKTTGVLFVCLGNICRSPTSEGVFRAMLERESLSHIISVDSAGTSNWHVGSEPDHRTSYAAQKRGYDLQSLRGRQVCVEDFQTFDYILAMDHDNLRELETLKPADYQGHLGLFLDFSSQSEYAEVPDPYNGGSRGFDLVLDLVEDGCEGLLSHVKKRSSDESLG